MYKALTTLIASNILFDFIIQAIIVERNLHTYYRLPTTTVKTSNDSEDYFILQCPYKSTVDIPKPKDMSVCLIVGRYSENEEKQKELIKAKSRSNLNTQVDYRYLKSPKLVKLVKLKNGKPYTMLLKPIEKKKKTISYKKPRTKEINEQYESTTNVKFILKPPRMPTTMNQTAVLYAVPIIQKLQLTHNDTSGSSIFKEPSNLNFTQTIKPETVTLKDDSLDEEDTQPTSALKYLAVPDTIKHPIWHPNATQQQYKSEKFFADSQQYKKGFRSKGFQNMYHRDEIYQDHIFYDDVQQMGNYRVNKKLQQKQP